jgi:hypothetical protein
VECISSLLFWGADARDYCQNTATLPLWGKVCASFSYRIIVHQKGRGSKREPQKNQRKTQRIWTGRDRSCPQRPSGARKREKEEEGNFPGTPEKEPEKGQKEAKKEPETAKRITAR